MGIFESTPREKFFEILFNADRAVARNELEKFFEIFVAIREFCDENGFDEAKIKSFIASNAQILQSGLDDIFIGLSGEILSKNE